jgi:hypothetical protein
MVAGAIRLHDQLMQADAKNLRRPFCSYSLVLGSDLATIHRLE